MLDPQGNEIPDRINTVTSSNYTSKDVNNNPMEIEYGLCEYKDTQVITIQEMPERAPMGQLPRSVDLILDDDLVDLVKPGDRIQSMGIFMALAKSTAGVSNSGTFKTVVLGNHVKVLGRDVKSLDLGDVDTRNILAMGKRGDVLDVLARSVAPSIYGHEYIKRALCLQLLGGMEKNLANGTHIRGDINILMVGDPSTAKSQLLRIA